MVWKKTSAQISQSSELKTLKRQSKTRKIKKQQMNIAPSGPKVEAGTQISHDQHRHLRPSEMSNFWVVHWTTPQPELSGTCLALYWPWPGLGDTPVSIGFGLPSPEFRCRIQKHNTVAGIDRCNVLSFLRLSPGSWPTHRRLCLLRRHLKFLQTNEL